jgi:hypothetical protein
METYQTQNGYEVTALQLELLRSEILLACGYSMTNDELLRMVDLFKLGLV